MMNNNIYSGNTMTAVDVQRALSGLLPESWQLTTERFEATRGPDAILSLRAPSGQRATIVLEMRQLLEPATAPNVIDALKSWTGAKAFDQQSVALLVAAPFLSERTRTRLRDSGISYLDLTGNIFLTIDEPAVLLRSKGLDKNPNREARPTRSLRGTKSAQIVRTLVDYRAPLGVRKIAELSGANPGNVSRVLSMLETQGLIQRSPSGGVQQVEWVDLLKAWGRDYSMTRSNSYTTYLDPRGLANFISRLQALPSNTPYAVTGSLAAARIAPVAPARMGVAYVDDAEAVAAKLGLIPAESGANVMLLESKGEFAFSRTRNDGGVRYVAPSQAAVDLLTGSGRNPSEAEELLDWMKKNEDVWRI